MRSIALHSLPRKNPSKKRKKLKIRIRELEGRKNNLRLKPPRQMSRLLEVRLNQIPRSLRLVLVLRLLQQPRLLVLKHLALIRRYRRRFPQRRLLMMSEKGSVAARVPPRI
jgi:hypothetical protein